ncbi:MAG: hypothetical protein K0S97_1367 [Chloroflexota bacterium]|nr:hypothetical protein [Chloroflexota bacterium]
MTKRRSAWLGTTGALFLVLSLSSVAYGVTPPDAVPDEVVDTTVTFEDIDGNGIDDDCQDVDAVADEDAAAAADLAVDANADGVVSTTEAAHSDRIGGKNCNHGGYVSWIAHQDVACEVTPTEPATEPAVELIVAEPGSEGEANEVEVEACTDDLETVKHEKAVAAELRAALKAERTLARETAKAERTATRDAAKAERTSARDAAKAERAAAKAARQAERQAAKAARTKKGH